VRDEIAEHLPDVDVRMLDHASIRADARINAHRKAMADLAAAEEHRARMRRQLESLAAILVPLVILVSGAWIGLLALGNVRERRVEIGILRALGLRTAQILKVFLLKAALVGLIGAAIGSVAGWLAGAAWSGAGAFGSEDWMWPTVAAVVLAAPLLSVLASWLPAVEAARQEPAAVLREE
jgi:ABC-type lipoprotein release transport system permease subunit